MGQTLSSNMNTILAGERQIDWTLDLTFPDASELHFATSSFTISRGTYTNDLESVSEIRQTLDAPVDRVSVELQNKDRTIGQHVASNASLWKNCEAIVGRYYQNKAGTVTDWIERFRGTVQQPVVDDLTVALDVIPDTIAPGLIVCNHSLAIPCQWLFKDTKTCGYAGVETVCNHLLKGDCTKYGNTHRFGGMDHFYNPDVSAPGSGGNDPGDIEPPPHNCPRLDQYVLVKGPDGLPAVKMVGYLTAEDELFNPISGRFHKTKSVTVVKDEPIWEMVAANGAVGYSSHTHRVLWFREHENGERADRFCVGDAALTLVDRRLDDTQLILSRDTGERAEVMRIEMEDGHIYAAGDAVSKLFVCHNAKPIEIL